MAKMQSLSDKEIKKAKEAEKIVEEFKEKLKSASARELASKGIARPNHTPVSVLATEFNKTREKGETEFDNSSISNSVDPFKDGMSIQVEQGGYEEVNGKGR